MHLTQPALSHRIKDLEAHFRMRLVSRQTPVRPTPEGAVLLGYAERLLATAEDADRALADLREASPAGHLRIFASKSWGFYLLPPALGAFQERHPDLAVELVGIANSHDLAHAVLSNVADVAVGIIGDAIGDPRLVAHELMTDEWYLVASVLEPDFPDSVEVPASLLNHKRLIIRERGSATRRLLEEIIAAEQLSPLAILEFSSTEAVKKAVEHNIGISLIAGAAIADEVRTGVLRAFRLADHRLEFPYFAATQRDRYISAATQAFLTFVRDLRYTKPVR